VDFSRPEIILRALNSFVTLHPMIAMNIIRHIGDTRGDAVRRMVDDYKTKNET